MTPATFAQYRKAAGLTQEAVASLWGVHRVTISSWERGLYPVPKWAGLLVRLLDPIDTNASIGVARLRAEAVIR